MPEKNIVEFGLDILEALQNDETFSFADGDLKLYFKGLTADSPEIASFIEDTNKVYCNTADEELQGNFLMCNMKVGEQTSPKIFQNARFNLDPYYDIYKTSGFDEVMDIIKKNLLEQQTKVSSFRGKLNDYVSKYESVRPMLIIRMLNYKRNSVRLDGTVYNRFGDMAICAYMLLLNDNDASGNMLYSTKIQENMLERYGVTREQIIDDAMKNSQRLYPERFYFNLFDTMDKTKGLSADETLRLIKSGEKRLNSMNPMLLLTNSIKLNGSTALFYPGVMEKVSEMLGGEFYAVFLSINEVMLHPRKGFTPRMMRESLLDLNNHFNSDEILTEQVYRYDCNRKQLREV